MTLSQWVATPWDAVVRSMQLLAVVACVVIALEQEFMWRRGDMARVWRPAALRTWWGWRRPLLMSPVPRMLPSLQLLLAAALLYSALQPARTILLAPIALAGLAATLWLTTVRFRSTVNGGSDGMLFTVLIGLMIATWPTAHPRARVAGILFVAAQVLLSYLRAGLVKARQPAWWNGHALRSFLAIPAYGVPAWVPQRPLLLRTASVAVVLFELAAPTAMLDPRIALQYSAVAWCFHLTTALIFGLNRFLLVWSAALPSVWFAAHLLHAR